MKAIKMEMSDIARARLISQQVLEHQFKTVKDLVGWMGAMQAQDYAMAKWAIGLRLPGIKKTDVDAAINHGEVIRTHVLRPTWHLVSADDIYWMLELTAARIKAQMKNRYTELGLSEAVIRKSNRVIEKTLQGGKHLRREELREALDQAGVPTDQNKVSHLLGHAELDGIICSGAEIGGKPSFTLLEERVPKKRGLDREEGLGKLALRYFTSHAPASVQDFMWWSSITARDAKIALEQVNGKLAAEQRAGKTYWLPENFSIPQDAKESVFLVPAFDELLISYADRDAILTAVDNIQRVFGMGMFKPILVIDGLVKGIWKRTIKKDNVILEVELFERVEAKTLRLIEAASEQFGTFLEKKSELKVTQDKL